VCVAPLTLNDRNVTQGCCPLKVLEYMAAGRPLVASNLPVVRELVRERLDGLLFAPDDPLDLARRRCARWPTARWRAPGQPARARAQPVHLARGAKRLARVYEKVLSAEAEGWGERMRSEEEMFR
jgi:glycosyltransferase involved in cell wall biosynthesis